MLDVTQPQVHIDWMTGSGLWDKILGKGFPSEIEDSEIEGHGTKVELGPTIPSSLEERSAFVTVAVEEGNLHWHLVLKECPTGSVPEEISEADDKIGGFPGLAALIREATYEKIPVAQYWIRFSLPLSRWTSYCFPQEPKQDLSGIASESEVVGMTFKLVGGALGIETIEIQQVDQLYQVTVEARGILRPVDDGCSYAKEVMDLLVKSLFLRKEDLVDEISRLTTHLEEMITRIQVIRQNMPEHQPKIEELLEKVRDLVEEPSLQEEE